MKVEITDTFDKWVNNLKDLEARKRIFVRIDRIKQTGNLGDCKSVGDGVFELRVNYGCGYRVYYTFRNNELVILLCGGDKSTQQNDIIKAKKMIKDRYKNDK